MRRIIGTMMCLAGIVLFGFLIVQSLQESHVQKQMLQQIEQMAVNEHAITEEVPASEHHPIGELTIPKIQLRVAVTEGASQSDLRYAVGHLPQSGRLGVMNENFVILGHRSHVTGKFFNRLNELETGDEISLQSPSGKWKYVVTKKRIISPEQVEVIQPVEGRSLVTLITCHPLYSNKQRLVVFAEKAS